MSFKTPFHALFSAKYKVRTIFQKRLCIVSVLNEAEADDFRELKNGDWN